MFRVSAATDQGRVRERNEDEYCVCRFTGERLLLAVADGMGGHQAGDVASRLAIEAFRSEIEAGLGTTDAHLDAEILLRRAVDTANRCVLAQSRSDSAYRGMGTTLTAVLCGRGQPLYWVHVGDTRLYHYHHGQLRQVTRDHSLAQELVRTGEITLEEAEYHSQRHILTRALGADPAIDADIGSLLPEAGDRLLLTSDGLTGVITFAELEAILAESSGIDGLPERLTALANERGGPDNITVIAVFVESEGEGA